MSATSKVSYVPDAGLKLLIWIPENIYTLREGVLGNAELLEEHL